MGTAYLWRSGRFFLWYEDEGDSYRYEEGVCSKVPVQWKDSERTLTIGLREELIPVCRNK
ncbi:DUF5110 domain-containing protein [Bacteroides sp. CR5/BHMF/2]|nr:DUF5110 domain-containing protein [Bacteroides sp. CR5/BHMF/2]